MTEASLAHEISQTPEIPKLKLDMASSSAASESHPEHNEDRSFFDPNSKSFGVFDGMGGEANGEEAAVICATKISEQLKHAPETSPRKSVTTVLQQSFNLINQAVLQRSAAEGKIMGSTATYGFIYKNELGVYETAIAHAGDSRAYLFRNGILTQITKDHGLINSQLAPILDNATDPSSLTPDQLGFYRQRNKISNFAGYSEGSADIFFQNVMSGDIILLTSDGVHDNLTTKEIHSILSQHQHESTSSITQTLVGASVSRSREKSFRSKKDDMTALVVKVSTNQEFNPKSNQTEKSTYLPKQGDPIKVERSSGIIEPGWEVFSVDEKAGDILAIKRGDPNIDRVVSKKIKIDLIERLNTPAKPDHIAKAETLSQLFYTLQGLKSVQGSSETFLSSYLIETIKAIKEGRKNLNTITRTYGLRDTVQRLLSKR